MKILTSTENIEFLKDMLADIKDLLKLINPIDKEDNYEILEANDSFEVLTIYSLF